ncbi:MAG TPA: polysaccharide pyruvyl transferase family protein [Clostridiales bacterium]|jgi:hypothetical protein|nr:polysaccharide pyruvyl transferase family protein [Clostridiales bacterium]
MKISVITLHTVKNYGSVLQTYATQKKFEHMKVEVEFVDYWRKNTQDHNLLHTFLSNSKKWNQNPFTRFIYKTIEYPSIHKRIHVFNRFLKQYIHLTPYRYLSYEELKANPPQADIYCTGSDQVWNSDCNGGIERPYFLEYVPKGKKRIAYAASFGKSKLSEKEQNMTKPLLQKYSMISVREDSGADILSNMGIDSVQILDPTLILKLDEWKRLMAKRQVRQEYLLIYQLNKNRDFDSYAKNFARKKKLKLIRLSYDYYHIIKPGHIMYCPTVEEWISLFYYADYIMTDSFHGTAFSINFNKQFSVFFPPKFSSRLASILQLTGLENRRVIDCDNFEQAESIIDYHPVNEILAKEREKADAFLAKAIKK